MSVPKIKFSGPSDSGKTSVISEVVRELKDRGHTVGVLKHDPHDHWSWDEEDTDTARHAGAGADAVSILSPERHGLYQFHDGRFDVDELIAKMDPKPDVVLLEGFKSRSYPGFEYADGQWEDHAGETFSHDDIGAMSDRIERFAHLNGNETECGETFCRLTVDGEEVPLKAFPKSALVEVVEGYVRSLDGVEPGRRLTLDIEHDDSVEE
jgi:molybdopterin-guanine dinucleotide biosynthesis protein MobB